MKQIDTLCVHGASQKEVNHAHITPIYASSTYTFDSVAHGEALFTGKEQGYIYGRFGSPTSDEAGNTIAALEAHGITNNDGTPLALYGLLHASGMAAISTVLMANLKAGDTILTHKSLYGGTQEMLDRLLPGLNIQALYVDCNNSEDIHAAYASEHNIKLMYLETPANPTLQCVDIKNAASIAKTYGSIVCVDNTFCTPLLQQPFRYDVDFVVHSTTKFLNGHGTAIGGILIGKDKSRMTGDVRKIHRLLGGNSNPFDAFLLSNGIKTLALRMDKHCNNAMSLAQYLSKHTQVAKVNYPGLPNHPSYTIASQQMKQFGSVMSVELKGGYEAATRFMDNLKLCTNAVSLGTCDTLISHPASTTHMGVSTKMRAASGITDGLIRISVGIENIDDIIQDFEQAFSATTN